MVDVQRHIIFEVGQKLWKLRLVKNSKNSTLDLCILTVLSRQYLSNCWGQEAETVHGENIYILDVHRRVIFEIGQKLPKLRLVKNSKNSTLDLCILTVLSGQYLSNCWGQEAETIHGENIYIVDVQRRVIFQIG